MDVLKPRNATLIEVIVAVILVLQVTIQVTVPTRSAAPNPMAIIKIMPYVIQGSDMVISERLKYPATRKVDAKARIVNIPRVDPFL